MKRILKRLLAAGLVLFLLFNVIICFHAYKFTHFTDKKVKRTEGNKQLSTSTKLRTMLLGVDNPRPVNRATPQQKFETVKIPSNVLLEAWSIKADSSKGTVIIFHGYCDSKSNMLDRSDELLKMGYNTLLVDFMGSGGSEGNTTTIGFKEAAEVKSCYDYLVAKGEKHVYLFGTSMGAVSIMKAMSDYHLEPTGVILECPFGSMYKTVSVRVRLMGANPFPVAGLLMFWGGVQNGFWAFSHNPTEYAKAIKCPTLLLWGEADPKVSRAETDEIFQNLAGPKTLHTYALAGHEDYLIKYKEEWINDVGTFMKITSGL